MATEKENINALEKPKVTKKVTGDTVLRCIGKIGAAVARLSKSDKGKVLLTVIGFILLTYVSVSIDDMFSKTNIVEAKSTSGICQIISKEEAEKKQSEYLSKKAEKQSETENQIASKKESEKNLTEEQSSAGVDAMVIANVAIPRTSIVTSITTNLEAERERDEENVEDDIDTSTTVENLEPETVYYTVQRGDTLWEISMKYGTTVENIAKINEISDVNLIVTGQVLKIETSLFDEESDTVESEGTVKEELTEEQKIEDWANTPARYRYTEEDVYLTACVGKAESGDSDDRYLSIQVFVNRQHINNTNARYELDKKDQYETTRCRIDNGQIAVTEEDLALAEKMLSGEINGFEFSNTEIPRKYWNKVYFQTKDPKEGILAWSNGTHWYALSKWIDNESNPYK